MRTWGTSVLVLVAGLSCGPRPVSAPTVAPPRPVEHSKLAFWGEQRRGTNFFNNRERQDRFAAARAIGVDVGRLVFNKWLGGRPESERGDFLLGPRGELDRVVAADLDELVRVLDDAEAANLPVVVTTLSLPGRRWSQHNCSVDEAGERTCRQERALWQDRELHHRAASFWRQLATRLRDHPAVVGYDILNEPSPEHVPPRLADWYTGDYDAWFAGVRGTAADLNLFYATVIRAIREVDPSTPIVVEPGFYGTPWGIGQLDPGVLDDDALIYSFHMYEPFRFVADNGGQYTYPGSVPTGELDTDDAPVVLWDRDRISRFFRRVVAWQVRHSIPDERIWLAELGVHRQNPGAAAYLRDLIDVVEEYGWHWSFYSFREDDGHQAMDYELGTRDTPPAYWAAWEDGRFPGADAYHDNELFGVVLRALRR